ncbi:hypothetical protein ACQ4PT_006047 [Festuca glaucescens]
MEHDIVISPEMEESVTEAEEAVKKEAEEGALLVGMDSIGGESSMRKQAKEAAGKISDMVEERRQMEWLVDEILQIKRRIALLGIKEKIAKKEAALLAGMYSTDGESLARKQAKEEAERKSEMQWQAEKHMMNYFSSLPTERGGRAIEQYYVMKYEAAEWKAFIAKAEKWKALLASQEKSARREKAKSKAKANEKARKAEASVTEAGRPEEALAEAGKTGVDMNSAGDDSFIWEEATNELGKRLAMMSIRSEMQLCAEEDYFPKEIQRALLDIEEKLTKKRNKKMAMETFLQLLKDLSNKLDLLDQGGDEDEKDEIDDTGKSANEGTNMTMVDESDKLLLEPADPSAINSRHDSVQDDIDHDRCKPAIALAKKTAKDKEIAYELETFASHRRRWETSWGQTCGLFKEITVLSPMQFTHYTPGRRQFFGAGSTPETLQIFSIKLTELDGGLELPLFVYGVVAVRDIVDRN